MCFLVISYFLLLVSLIQVVIAAVLFYNSSVYQLFTICLWNQHRPFIYACDDEINYVRCEDCDKPLGVCAKNRSLIEWSKSYGRKYRNE